jgi:hypothetical protein
MIRYLALPIAAVLMDVLAVAQTPLNTGPRSSSSEPVYVAEPQHAQSEKGTGSRGTAPILAPLALGGRLNRSLLFSVQGLLSGTMQKIPQEYSSPMAAVVVNHDTASQSQSPTNIPALTVFHRYGGGGAGSRVGIWSNLFQADGPTGGAWNSGERFHTGIFSNVVTQSPDQGSAGHEGASYYAFAGQMADNAGYHYGITGGEIDIALSEPTTLRKEGWSIGSVPLQFGNDAYHGKLYDAGLGIWAGGSCGAGSGAGESGCAGFNYGISFRRDDGYFGVSSAGTIIGVSPGLGTATARDGIDFSNVDFSDCAYKSKGFCVNNAGNLQASLTTPASSTSSCSVGQIVWDADYIYVCTAPNTWKRATLTTF